MRESAFILFTEYGKTYHHSGPIFGKPIGAFRNKKFGDDISNACLGDIGAPPAVLQCAEGGICPLVFKNNSKTVADIDTELCVPSPTSI